jgi:putative membrane protein
MTIWRKKVALIGAAAVLGLGACSDDSSRRSQPMAGETVRSASANTMQYVEAMANGNMFEIQSSQLALQKSRNASVRRFAQRMIDEHTRMTTQLSTAVRSTGPSLTVPTQMDSRHQSAIQDLQGVTGRAFDRMYLTSQINAHNEALIVNQNYAQMGDDPALRQLANSAIPVIQEHLDQAQRIAGPARVSQRTTGRTTPQPTTTQ